MSESERCGCGADREDWRHILVECSMYEDIRDLSAWGVRMDVDGRMDFSGVLQSRARNVFVCLRLECSISGLVQCVGLVRNKFRVSIATAFVFRP